MHKAWRSIEEGPYCFFRSSIKFPGHMGPKIKDLNPSDLPSFILNRTLRPNELENCICIILVNCFCITVVVNSSPPSAAYMHQWTGSALVQTMCARGQAITWTNAGLLSIGPLSDKFQWNSNRNTEVFINENAFESVVCKMAAILSRGRWVKVWSAKDSYYAICGGLFINP